MVDESIEKLSEERRKKNATFAAVSPAEKRVMIAKDVLEHLDAKKIQAKQGAWVRSGDDWDGSIAHQDEKFDEFVQMCDVLDKVEACDACALGGLFVCAVKRADELTVKDALSWNKKDVIVNYDVLSNYMHQFFTGPQLRLIEIAFENGHGQYTVTDELERQAGDLFGRCTLESHCSRCDGDEEDEEDEIVAPDTRLRLIAKCMIRNNGDFVPGDVWTED